MAVKTTVELSDLVGKGILDAVDFSTESREMYRGHFEDSQVCRFRLNGVVYVAVEDPCDGYRSSMAELVVQRSATPLNVFPPCEVVGVHRTNGGYGVVDDILELVDTKTGKVVLEVGTENTSDYYPSFVASFHPENMAINLERF